MIRIERNKSQVGLLVVAAVILLAAAAYLHFVEPRSSWGIPSLWTVSGAGLAKALLGLACMTLAAIPCLRFVKGNVELRREGILIQGSLLWRWGDIQSVRCFHENFQPGCNVTFNDGKQRPIPSLLLGENFGLIEQVFRDPVARASLDPCTDPRWVETRYVAPQSDGPVKPLISLDPPSDPRLLRFLLCMGALVLSSGMVWVAHSSEQNGLAIGAAVVALVIAVFAVRFFKSLRKP